MKTLNAQLRKLRQILGVRHDVLAAVTLAVLGAGGLSFTLITHTGTPAGAALAYLAAVDRADTDYVWSHTTIDASGTSDLILNASLLDRNALAAQLTANAHTRSALTVQDVHFDSQYTKVMLTYSTKLGVASTSLEMRGEAPHQWSVVSKPAGLRLLLPPGEVSVGFDGYQLFNGAVAAVFPGLHQVTLRASDRYMAFTGQVNAQTVLPDVTVVNFAGVRLTPAGFSEVDQAVASAFTACARSTQLTVPDCPQRLPGEDVANGNVTWTLLGDPLGGSTVGIDGKTSDLVVTGHFLMALTYDSQAHHGIRRFGVGSPYVATFNRLSTTLTVSGFGDASAVLNLARPAATDAQVLAALKSQFDACLKLQAAASSACPQSVPAFYASNFVWHEDSDPLQGAGPVWDGKRSMLTVAGSFSFSVSYDSSPPFSPTTHYQDHSSGQYLADLYWDGSKVVFVGFEE